MDIVYDGKFCYRPPAKPEVGWCHLQVLRGKTHSLLLSTELSDNPGLPMVNAVIHILIQAANLFGLDPAKLQYIEHYPATSGKIEYYHVTFEWRDLTDFPHMPVYPALSRRPLLDGKSRIDLSKVNAIIEAL